MHPLNFVHALQNADKPDASVLALSPRVTGHRPGRSQRQVRLSRRRAHAAGRRFAFFH